MCRCAHVGTCYCSTPALNRRPLLPPLAMFSADTEVARKYEVELDSQFVPLGIYTREVDYPDVGVQVRNNKAVR